MSQLVVLNLGTGDWHQGCASVVAQLWLSDQTKPTQCYGSLPPVPELGDLLSRWQQFYLGLCTYKNWQYLRNASFDIEIDASDITHVSDVEFKAVCRQLGQALNRWLDAESFRSIDRQLRTRLSHTDEVRFVITAADRHLLELPWFLWQFFEDFPQAEPAFSLPEYSATQQRQGNPMGDPGGSGKADRVKILAILGNAQGIDLTEDQLTLKQLPNADVQFLVEPGLPELTQQLWTPGLNLLFFAGHSSSRCEGRIQVNATNALTLDQLRYGLKRAIAQGLQLAIFNSCDGVKLAWELADLHIPIVIVMRAAVPNPVAQAFLKSFLSTFAGGQSLYSAVRIAREQLQGLEAEFPCASWLPVIYQNPAESPPHWQDWVREQPSHQLDRAEPISTVRTAPTANKRSIWRPLSAVILSSLVVTGAILGVRSPGWIQPLELWAFDRLLTLRPIEQPDSRLLVITIDDADIQAQNPEQRRGSLSDAALEQLLDQLEKNQPSAIGLDIYRDFPVLAEHPRLAAQLRQNSRFIAVCKVSDATLDPTGTLPPPEVPTARLGFSDALRDSDGVLRRHLLAMTPPPASPCTTPYSLGARLAFLYLRQKGIQPQFTADGDLQLGSATFPRLHSRSNGYQGIDARGNQVLLHYRALRSPRNIAPQVTLTQVLQGKVAASAVRDRIVLIGVTAASSGDYWTTPYGSGRDAIPGVFVQAHVISQFLSAALDQRPPLRVWSLWGEWLWIGFWSAVGGFLVWVGPFPKGMQSSPLTQWCLVGMVGLGSLTGLGWCLMVQGYWVPLVPPAVGLLTTAGLMAYWGDRSRPA